MHARQDEDGPALRVWRDGSAVWATRIGRGWIAVPDTVWTAFTAAVKRGDYDHR